MFPSVRLSVAKITQLPAWLLWNFVEMYKPTEKEPNEFLREFETLFYKVWVGTALKKKKYCSSRQLQIRHRHKMDHELYLCHFQLQRVPPSWTRWDVYKQTHTQTLRDFYKQKLPGIQGFPSSNWERKASIKSSNRTPSSDKNNFESEARSRL